MVIASIVLAGPEEFIPVIVVIVVIGKIIAAIKEAASKGSGPGQPAGKQKLEQDLERFFQKLSNQENIAPATPPPPPPVPAAARPVRRVVPQAQAVPPPPPMAARPVPAVKKPRVAPVAWGSEHYGVDKSAPSRASCSYSAKKSRRDIVAMLKDENSIKKAVLLREVLGPPVSMRG